MKRAHFLRFAPLFLLAACQGQPLTSPTTRPSSQQIPAVAVNDPCSAYTTADACKGTLGGVAGSGTTTATPASTCAWMPVDACPAGATCPSGVCVTTDPCSVLTTAAACYENVNCVWSEIVAAANAPALCPVGQDCAAGGFCFQRDTSGGGNACLCVQPLACPKDGACPPVQCDCPPPPPVDAGSGGGGTCTCGCPSCGPGEACPPCDCQCGNGSGGTGGAAGGCGTSTGGTSGTGGSPGTCTCNCPACPVGADCPACSCSCSGGATTTMTVPAGTSTGTATGGTGTASPGTTATSGTAVPICECPACPANTACAPCDCTSPPPDPCTAYTDAKSCTADTADQCGWTSLGIACFTTPCPSGVCARIQPVVTSDGGSGSGGGGCACACPACATGQTCPPCNCSCCPAPPPTPVGITQVSADAGSVTVVPPAGGSPTPL